MPTTSTTERTLTFPHEKLRVRPLVDPVLDALGHDPRSAYVEQYWLSVLGPSAVFLVRRLANGIEAQPDGFELDPTEWAAELGLGTKGGKNSPFWRSIDRICRFGAAQRNDDLLAVRRRLPPLSRRQIERLPDHLRRAHDRWSQHRLATPRRKTISQWSERHELARGRSAGSFGTAESVGAVASQHRRHGLGEDGQVDDE